jgi:hypothetical protein
MALLAIVQDVNSIDEKFRGLYKQLADGPKKGWHVLDVQGAEGFGLEDVGGLKSALSGERTKVQELAATLKSWEGLEPNEVRSLISKRDEMLNWKPDEKVEAMLQKRLGDAKGPLEAKVKELSDAIGAKTSMIHKLTVGNGVTAALAKLKGNADLLMPHVERRARVDDSNGEPSVYFVEDDGKTPMLTRKSGTGRMGIEEFCETLKGTFPTAFEGTAPRGSGATGGAGGATGQPHTIRESDALDRTKFKAAEAAANAAGLPLQIVKD